jgi:hypothetical protein
MRRRLNQDFAEETKIAAAALAALSKAPGVMQPVQTQIIDQVTSDSRSIKRAYNQDVYEITSFDVYEEDKDAFETALQWFPQ